MNTRLSKEPVSSNLSLIARIGALAFTCVCASAHGGYYNCSVIYDEFDSLMNNQFLVEPGRYVATVPQRLTRSQYEKLQKGRFKLYEERADLGVAVFRTNMNLYGKALFRFTEALPDGQPHLMFEHVVLFSRVADGYGPRWLAPARIKPAVLLDLDTGEFADAPNQDGAILLNENDPDMARFDLIFGLDRESSEPAFEAINGAQLFFPIESLCHDPAREGARTP